MHTINPMTTSRRTFMVASLGESLFRRSLGREDRRSSQDSVPTGDFLVDCSTMDRVVGAAQPVIVTVVPLASLSPRL